MSKPTLDRVRTSAIGPSDEYSQISDLLRLACPADEVFATTFDDRTSRVEAIIRGRV